MVTPTQPVYTSDNVDKSHLISWDEDSCKIQESKIRIRLNIHKMLSW